LEIIPKISYICKKERPVDNHHIDCAHGGISDETVLLCRRCHRTYHDLGVEWFDDEYLDRALEIENKRRTITYANLKDSVIPLHLLERKDIKRTDYWDKIHGIKVGEPVKKLNVIELFLGKCIAPLCGWDWLRKHGGDKHPEQWIEIKYDNKPVAKVAASAKRGAVRKAMRLARSMVNR